MEALYLINALVWLVILLAAMACGIGAVCRFAADYQAWKRAGG
jgi:hypothetical protein